MCAVLSYNFKSSTTVKKFIFFSDARLVPTVALKYWTLHILFVHFRFVYPFPRYVKYEDFKLFN